MLTLLLAIVLTTFLPNYSVEVRQNIPYSQAVGYWCESDARDDRMAEQLAQFVKREDEKMLTLRMDVYRPHEISGRTRLPLILLAHGGAFFTNSKSSMPAYQLCRDLAGMGYIAVSIDYRLGFEMNKESIDKAAVNAVEDVQAALDFLVNHARSYGIDTTRIILGGSSSGAITILKVAAQNKTHCIIGIIDMWGGVERLDILDGCDAPLIAFHGDQDNKIPFTEGYPMGGKRFNNYMYGSKPLVEHLQGIGKDAELTVFKGYGHGPYRNRDYSINSNYDIIRDKVLSFVGKIINLQP